MLRFSGMAARLAAGAYAARGMGAAQVFRSLAVLRSGRPSLTAPTLQTAGMLRPMASSGPDSDDLTPQEQHLRAKMLAQATLKESAQGKQQLFDDVRSKLELIKEQTAQAEEIDAGAQGREAETPLVQVLRERIRLGPVSMAEYMSLCLAHPQHGYYMRRDVFGSAGDFTTAPEISQMFGEIIGVWVVWTWQALGSPPKFQLIELGPGRGTMMSDVLRTCSKFRPLLDAMTVHMVETSPALRTIQRKKLATGANPKSETVHHDGTGVLVQWHDALDNVPMDAKVPSIILGQEFLDCMPVHQFHYTEKGWCEKMVDLNPDNGPLFLRHVLSPGPTAASKICLNPSLVPKIPENPKLGHRIEVSPEAWWTAQSIGKRVKDTQGAALLIDYGQDGPPEESIQAVKDHKYVSVLEQPGNCDVTAHVDFSAVKISALDVDGPNLEAIRSALDLNKEGDKSEESKTQDSVVQLVGHGPVTQCDFLHGLGIRERTMALMDAASESQAQKIAGQYERLVSPDEMGSLFKVLAITPGSIVEGSMPGFPPPQPPITTDCAKF